MKLFKIIVMAAALMGFAASCNEIDSPKTNETSMSFTINTGITTKSLQQTDVDGEKIIRDAQIFIFMVDPANPNDPAKQTLYRKLSVVFSNSQSQEVTISKDSDPAMFSKFDGDLKGFNANTSYITAVFVNGYAAKGATAQGFQPEEEVVLDKIQNLAELRAKTVRLASSAIGDGASNARFAMYGESEVKTIEVNKNTEVPVTVQRFVSRISLVSVQNKIPEGYTDFKIEKVFVINARSQWNMQGTIDNGKAATSGNFNWGGEKPNQGGVISVAADCYDGDYQYGNQTFIKASALPTGFINNYWKLLHQAGGSEADAAAGSTYSFLNGDQRTAPFYVFPNTNPSDATADTGSTTPSSSFNGFSSSNDACTRLVVYASFMVNGERKYYYYPVTIPAMDRNKFYDVYLVVSGFGSDHPNREPIKGSMSVTIGVKPWDGGSDINQEY